ncbi:membrane-associated protein, putative [Bodo saltans]|uniref:Membrane-associated protein, putative n=1 Tax=Bodo saltans TaxID=75058 RepID=A0A0S4IX21_BODSA|nr:membrane-associated protein, putative [Bodo saltans]|eukprot:CUG06210.1 membrane-associated protein, putative [Bodo saltans]
MVSSALKKKESIVIIVVIIGLCALLAALPSAEISPREDEMIQKVEVKGAVRQPLEARNGGSPLQVRNVDRSVVPRKEVPIVPPLSIATATSRVQTMLPAATKASYFQHFSSIMEDHLGSELWAAVYDQDALGEMARAAAAGTLGDDDRFVWHINKLRSPPVDPVPFSSPAAMLRLLKRLVSVGIGRVHRDVEMAKLYAHTSTSPAASSVFRRALLRVVESYVNYFFTVIQLTVDAANAPVREALSKAQQQSCEPHGTDVMALLMTSIYHDTPISTIAALLEKTSTELSTLVLAQQTQIRAAKGDRFRSGHRVLAMFPIEYDAESYGGQRPVNGKFWNMIRPTASCTSLVRLCEKPDGCRLLCNAEYLLHAGLQSPHQRIDEYHHRLAGFGSNNEYDWEMSLVKMFQRGKKSIAPSAAAGQSNLLVPPEIAVHDIGWFTVFDCTLGSGNRQWSPPEALTARPIGFGYASKCLDAKSSATAYGFGDVKRVLIESEIAVRDGKQHEAITRRKVCPDTLATVVADASKDLAHRSWVAASRDGGATQVRLFDGLSILKVDVEGYEFNAIPEWARDELRNLGATSGNSDALAKGTASSTDGGENQLIDFEHAIDSYLSVSLLSMEFHRSGHKYNHGASLRGAQRSHYTLLNIYSLGFLMAGQEKNHQDNCCYELVWVHYRHFVRSEIWMAVGDSL